jgi:Ca2+-binding EF-hand superfamily protein
LVSPFTPARPAVGHSFRYLATILPPIVVLGLAVLLATSCYFASLKIISGSDAPQIVLKSDYNDTPSRQLPDKVSTMYDWAKGVGAKAEKGYTELDEVKVKQSQEDSLRIKRQRKMVDLVLGVIRENMINLRVSAAQIFAEFDDDNSGELTYWEFTKGCEKLGVKLSDGRMEMVMRELDGSGDGSISLAEFDHALSLNKFRNSPPVSPDEWTPMDNIWNKIYHALGAPDAQALARTFDSEDVGALGRDRFEELLKAHNTELNSGQLDLVAEVLDPRETGAMDIPLFATNLGASARRLEASLHTKLFAAVEAHGGIGYGAPSLVTSLWSNGTARSHVAASPVLPLL